MRRQTPNDSPRRRYRPALEGLEARDLPAPIPALGSAPGLSDDRSASVQARAHAFPDPAVIANSIKLIYGPNSLTPRIPTAREVKRETFTARWVGTYFVGPPRFDDRISTIQFFSKRGGSNGFLKGKLAMALFPPADPHATPTPGNPFANEVTGIVTMFPQNLLQTGSMFFLDAVGQPASASDPKALPTHLSWTLDAFAGAGAFVAPAIDFFQGAGVLDIQYLPDRHPLAGSMGSGRMIVSIQGVMNYSQLFSDVSKAIS
jgi:hypothetical protein